MRRAHEAIDADVNQRLRAFLDERRSFDAIVLDPPKLAPTIAHAERAARAYKDINRLALMLLRPGGALFTFSCSGGIDAGLFHKIVAGAGIDAGVDGFIHARLGAARGSPDDDQLPGRRVPEGPRRPQALTGAAGKAIRVSNLARRTLKNALTLRTLASCVKRRSTRAW